MNVLKADFDNWHIQIIPDDGARISVLTYDGFDLLSPGPVAFRQPERFYGEYETRPVYGYDDCFPTVDQCLYPGGGQQCRDHGELCWQKWDTEVVGNSLICSTECPQPHVSFKRILRFEGRTLIWRFEVAALAEERSVFLHVMHALLPLQQITDLEIPECKIAYDEINSEETGLKSAAESGECLLAFQPDSFGMFLLKEIADGFVKLKFGDKVKLEIRFDHNLFPTLGIWWNNGGYPADGQRRTECAFEPIPGTSSDLAKSYNDGVYFSVEPGKPMIWEITWAVAGIGA